jgi:hypothetical protein
MLSENEQRFVNVCGTSSVQVNSEAAEVADEIDRRIDRLSTKSNLRPPIFFQETGPLLPLALDWPGCGVHTGTTGFEIKRKKCYKI